MRAAAFALLLLTATSAAADPAQDLAAAFGKALGAGDSRGMAKAFALPLRYEGMHFTYRECPRLFAPDGIVTHKDLLRPFAICMTTMFSHGEQLTLLVGHDDTRPLSLDGVDPGSTPVMVWKAPRANKIVRIAMRAPAAAAPDEAVANGGAPPAEDLSKLPPPPLPLTVLEPLRIAGEWPGKRDGAVKAFAIVCFDAAGAFTRARVLKKSGVPAWDAEVERVLAGWKIRPYHVPNRPDPQPVCASGVFAKP